MVKIVRHAPLNVARQRNKLIAEEALKPAFLTHDKGSLTFKVKGVGVDLCKEFIITLTAADLQALLAGMKTKADLCMEYIAQADEAERRAKQGGQELPPDDYLSRPVKIWCCKDGTITYGDKHTPKPIRAAIPVFSTNLYSEAEEIILTLCKAQYDKHPNLPKQTWYRIILDNKPYLEDGPHDLNRVSLLMQGVWDRIPLVNEETGTVMAKPKNTIRRTQMERD